MVAIGDEDEKESRMNAEATSIGNSIGNSPSSRDSIHVPLEGNSSK
jgi:hypothetical protein